MAESRRGAAFRRLDLRRPAVGDAMPSAAKRAMHNTPSSVACATSSEMQASMATWPSRKRSRLGFVRERRAVVRRAHLAHAPQRQPAIGGDARAPAVRRGPTPRCRKVPANARAATTSQDTLSSSRAASVGCAKARHRPPIRTQTGANEASPVQSAKVDCGVEKVSCSSSSTGPPARRRPVGRQPVCRPGRTARAGSDAAGVPTGRRRPAPRAPAPAGPATSARAIRAGSSHARR